MFKATGQETEGRVCGGQSVGGGTGHIQQGKGFIYCMKKNMS